MIGRREVLAGLGSTAAASTSAWGQAGLRAPVSRQPPFVAGFIGLASAEADSRSLAALRAGVLEHPPIDGHPIVVVSRHADRDHALAAAHVRELEASPVGAYVSPGPAITRLLHRMSARPIVAIGLSASDADLFTTMARPGGRVTGFSNISEELSAKRIEIISEALPGIRGLGILHNATDPTFRQWGDQTIEAARRLGIEPIRLALRTGERAEIDAHLQTLKAARASAVLVVRDFMTSTAQPLILAAADAAGIAIMAEHDAFTAGGAMMSYGPDNADLFRRAGGVLHRILQGADPAELPIESPTRYQLIFNMRTARRLGLQPSPLLLARADEVIE